MRLQTLQRFLAAGLLLVAGCADRAADSKEAPAAETLIKEAIAAQGGAALDHAVVTFGFREAQFRLERDGGRFSYARSYRDSLGRRVREVLTNDSLYRRVSGQRVSLTEDERSAVRTAVNSVAYFALLPYPLGDPAVQAEHAGRDTLDGVPYRRVAVTFREEGGGGDYQDRFLYWLREEDGALDYLAYAFGLGADEELGTRFREAFNPRTVGGVRFADYRNYTADSLAGGLAPDQLARYSRLFEEGALQQVSTVVLDSVSVEPLD